MFGCLCGVVRCLASFLFQRVGSRCKHSDGTGVLAAGVDRCSGCVSSRCGRNSSVAQGTMIQAEWAQARVVVGLVFPW